MSFPPLAALFLTHFDDIKGQSTIFYTSNDGEGKISLHSIISLSKSHSGLALTPKQIEHTTLPSGLHVLTADLILFTHHHLPGIGLFRSRDTPDEGGRGRRMGTLGVVLGV